MSDDEDEEEEGFGELLRYTAAGYAGGLVAGGALDTLGFQRSGVGQWLVRTLAGEGESLLEGVFALRRRLAGEVEGLRDELAHFKQADVGAPEPPVSITILSRDETHPLRPMQEWTDGQRFYRVKSRDAQGRMLAYEEFEPVADGAL